MITKEFFDKTSNGEEIYCYTLENNMGMAATVLTLGGIVKNIIVPDKDGVLRDVVLGFDTAAAYEEGSAYIGAVVGRHANRLGGAFIKIDDEVTKLTANVGTTHLHGGENGFDKKIFTAKVDKEKLFLTCTSKDGEEGYPGDLVLIVCYEFSDEGALAIEYTAVSNKDTVVNITNHSYFNLNGVCDTDILNHTIAIASDSFTENDIDALPTGKIINVENTPMDFRIPKKIGQDINADYPPITQARGYDHNYILNKPNETLGVAAIATGDLTGITMICATTCPAVQFYTANYLNDRRHKERAGFCLETQYFPNSMNCENFKKPILRAGDTYLETTIYMFE